MVFDTYLYLSDILKILLLMSKNKRIAAKIAHGREANGKTIQSVLIMPFIQVERYLEPN